MDEREQMNHYEENSGLHTIERLRYHVRKQVERVDSKPAEWQRTILMELLLHIYDKLACIEREERTGE